MAEFTVNSQRQDPYKNFKFRVKWDGRYIAGISRISALNVPSRSLSIGRVVIQARVENHQAKQNTRLSR